MATAYSTLLGLALPVQGELSGTWGDMVDNGITRYVDIAVAGTVTLTNDGAVSLSLTNGDSSATNIVSSLTGAGTVSAQFAIIKVTGTLTTAKILTPPSSSRTYVVVNAATGSTVTVKASGQTGVSIAVGETAFVYFNGTDYVKVSSTVATGVTSFQTSLSGLTPSTSTTGAVTLAGTLGTSSGGTGLTSFTSGGVVYASSSSALATGTGFTYNGTSASIGDSLSGADGSKLYIYGNIPVSTQLGIKIAGNANAFTQHAIRFYDSYFDAYAGYIGFTTNSLTFGSGTTEGLRLTSTSLYTASGINVGIGTSSPAAKLDVVGTGSIISATRNDTNRADMIVTNSGGTVSFGINSSTGGWLTNGLPYYGYILGPTSSSYGLQFGVGASNTAALTISPTGNAGLGVTPSAWNTSYKALELVGGWAALSSNDGYGTAHLTSNCYATSTTAWAYKSASSYRATRYQMGIDGIHAWFNSAAGTAGNAISFTQAMTLDASGNLGVGTTSPSYRLDVKGATGENATLAQFGSGTNAGRGLTLSLSAGGTAVNDAFAVYNSTVAGGYAGHIWQAAGTERARISPNGGFAVGTTADPGAGAIYATGNITAYYSDARLKTVSGKIENALDKVAQLSGVYYTNNAVAKSFGYDSDEVQVGVLAQDVEAVLPQIVKAAPFDLDQDGNSKSGENYKTVQYERLVPLLIEAINELQAKVKALESK